MKRKTPMRTKRGLRRGRPLRRGAPIRYRPDRTAVEDDRKQKRRLYRKQGGKCAGCGKVFALEDMDKSHREGLGMGRDRYDRDHPLNQDENQDLRCRPCHRAWEEKQRRAHAAWMRGDE